jgi:hypothetical protein
MEFGDYPVVSSFVPTEPILTVEKDENGMAIRYCLDAHSEKILQNQRVLQMAATGPLIVYAAVKMQDDIWKRVGIGLIGFLTMYSNFRSYQVVREAEKRK